MPPLKKERAQLFLLLGLWFAGGLVALHYFVLSPFLAKRGKNVHELNELNENIQKARLAAQDEARVREEHLRALADLRRAMEQYVVPPDSALSWVSERIYATARGLGVTIRSVTPMRMPDAAWDAMVKGGRFLRPYAVQVVLECGYDKLLALVQAFESSNPFLCLTGINVQGQEQNVTRHVVTLRVEWPLWGRPPGIEIPVEEAAKDGFSLTR